ncbi:MAG: nucleoside triphosphate pyrophosphohydrolase [Alphaproteobacteria bacterium]
MAPAPPTRDLAALSRIMADLRTPETGCPWDLDQTFATIAPFTIEEAYEVADAIARGDMADLLGELGDLLLQVVYHARLAEEVDAFDLDDVIAQICEKMLRRHPHVFGPDAATHRGKLKPGFWEDAKAQERQRGNQQKPDNAGGALAGVAVALPALTRAVKLQKRAARVGFDWPDLQPVLAKAREELDEFEAALKADPDHQAEEIGDLLFVCANLARHANIDPEAALAAANRKFIRRFAHIERRLAEKGSSPENSTLAEMDALWDEAKMLEKSTL